MPAARSTAKTSGQIVLQRIGRSKALVPVVGVTPLIVNRFSEKARAMMLAKQMGEVVQRENKNPEALFEASMYRMPIPGEEEPGYGFSSVAFKGAIVDAARFFKGSRLPMTDLKRMVFVNGTQGTDPKDRTLLTRLWGETPGVDPAKPEMREDHVRNETGVADIRFRAEFWPWSVVLEVIWVGTSLSPSTIIALIDAAGSSGIGEWRPGSKESNTGTYGCFQVPADAETTVKVMPA